MRAAIDARLESWKQIAAYFNRGVRTVRRWETEEGLPIHRHMHRTLGSVNAYKSEIDASGPAYASHPVGFKRHADRHRTVANRHFDRRAALHQPERRSGKRVLRRRPHGGSDFRPLQVAGASRHLANVVDDVRGGTVRRESLRAGARVASGFRLRGWIQYARGRIQDAVVSLEAALERDPNDADTLLLLCNC